VAALKKQSYLLAGNATAKAKVRPILQAIGAGVFDFGDQPPAANLAKLAVNFLIAAAIEAMAEAFIFTAKNGADADKLLEMIGNTLSFMPYLPDLWASDPDR
jgi:3-hydroxyisobutyrate dehydrogenase-like beta-hydroxyacid dehydrogenase